jgi:hypothetical protein
MCRTTHISFIQRKKKYRKTKTKRNRKTASSKKKGERGAEETLYVELTRYEAMMFSQLTFDWQDVVMSFI